MADNFWRRHWSAQRAARVSAVGQGRVHIWAEGTRLHVAAPYDRRWVTGAAELGGRYREKSAVWSFPRAAERLVRTLAGQLWGAAVVDGRPEETR